MRFTKSFYFFVLFLLSTQIQFIIYGMDSDTSALESASERGRPPALEDLRGNRLSKSCNYLPLRPNGDLQRRARIAAAIAAIRARRSSDSGAACAASDSTSDSSVGDASSVKSQDRGTPRPPRLCELAGNKQSTSYDTLPRIIMTRPRANTINTVEALFGSEESSTESFADCCSGEDDMDSSEKTGSEDSRGRSRSRSVVLSRPPSDARVETGRNRANTFGAAIVKDKSGYEAEDEWEVPENWPADLPDYFYRLKKNPDGSYSLVRVTKRDLEKRFLGGRLLEEVEAEEASGREKALSFRRWARRLKRRQLPEQQEDKKPGDKTEEKSE